MTRIATKTRPSRPAEAPHRGWIAETVLSWRRFKARGDARRIVDFLKHLEHFTEKRSVDTLLKPLVDGSLHLGRLDVRQLSRLHSALKEIDGALAVDGADVHKVYSNPAALEAMKTPEQLSGIHAKLAKLARDHANRVHSSGMVWPIADSWNEFEIRLLLSKDPGAGAVLTRLDAFLKEPEAPDVRDPTPEERRNALAIQLSKPFGALFHGANQLRALLKANESTDGMTRSERSHAPKLLELFDAFNAAKGPAQVFPLLKLGEAFKNSLTGRILYVILPEIKRTSSTPQFEKLSKSIDILKKLEPGDWEKYGITGAMREVAAKLLPLLLLAKGKGPTERAVIEARFNRIFDANYRVAYKLSETIHRFERVTAYDVFKKVDEVAAMFGASAETLKLLNGTNPVPTEIRAFLEKFLSLKSKLSVAGADRLDALSQLRKLMLTSTAKKVASVADSTPLKDSSDANVLLNNKETLGALLQSGLLSAKEKELVQHLLQKLFSFSAILGAKRGASPAALNALRTIIALNLSDQGSVGKKLATFLRDLESYTERKGDRKVDSLSKATDLLAASDDGILRQAGDYIKKMNAAESTNTKNLYRMLASSKINNLKLTKASNDQIETLTSLEDGVFQQFLALNAGSDASGSYAALKGLIDDYRNGTQRDGKPVDAQTVFDEISKFSYDGKFGREAIASAKTSIFNEILNEVKNGALSVDASGNPVFKFDGVKTLTLMNKEGDYSYFDAKTQKVATFKGTLNQLLMKLLLERLKTTDVEFKSPDGDALTAKDYVQLIELKSMMDSGWRLGYDNFSSGASLASGWKPTWDGTIPAEWMAGNVIDRKKVEARLKLYESSEEFAGFLRDSQAAVRTEQTGQMPFLDPAKITVFADVLESSDFAKWMAELGNDGKPIAARSELASTLLGAINTLDSELGAKALKTLTENQVTLQVDKAFNTPPTEAQINLAAQDMIELWSKMANIFGNLGIVVGGMGASDWTKFKAIMASVIGSGAWKRGETIQSAMAEFDRQCVLQGASATQKSTFKTVFMEAWKTGTFHVYWAQPASLLAGILGLISAKDPWDRVRAAGNLLDAVSWSHYLMQKLAFAKTRPNETKSILNMIAADRGQMGNRLLSNAPEWLKLSDKYKKSASATAVNNLITNLSSPTLTFNSTITAAATKDMTAIIDSFTKTSVDLEIERKHLEELKRQANGSTANPATNEAIKQSETKIATLVAAQEGIKDDLAKMGMGRVVKGGTVKDLSGGAQKRINDFFELLKSKIDLTKPVSVMKTEITEAIDAKRLEIIKSTLVDAGMDPNSPELKRIADKIRSEDGFALFKKDNRAFLLGEMARTSLNSSAVSQFDKVSAALADWNAKEIIAGVKMIGGKLVKIDDVLKLLKLNYFERESIITALELTAGKTLHDNPFAPLFNLKDAAIKEVLKDWTFDDLKVDSWTDAEGRSWTIKEWLESKTALTGEALNGAVEKIKADVAEIIKTRIVSGSQMPGADWRYNSGASDYFDVLKDLEDPAKSGTIADLIDNVRAEKFDYWANETYDLIKDTKVSDLMNGNIRRVGSGGEVLTSLKSQLIAKGMSAADADIMENRIRLIAAAEPVPDVPASNWLSGTASSSTTTVRGKDVIRQKWSAFNDLDQAGKLAIFEKFDGVTKDLLMADASKGFDFDAKLQANKVSALLTTSTDIANQKVANTLITKRLVMGALFRNALESMGILASIVDVVLGAKDMVDGIKQKQALLGIGGAFSLTAGVLGLAGGVAIFQAGAVFALAVPLSVAAILLGAVAIGIMTAFTENKARRKVRKAYEDALLAYSPKYMQEGWHDKMKKMIKDISQGDYVNA